MVIVTRMRSRSNPSTRAIAQRFPDRPVQRRDGESPKPLNAITGDAEIGADLIAHGGQFETRNAALIDITIIRIHRSLPARSTLNASDIDGVLDDWSPCNNRFDLAFVVGTISGDRKERFADGTLMTTSLLSTPIEGLGEGVIVQTLNSRYLLGRRAVEVTSDAFLYAAGLGSWVVGPDDRPVMELTVKAKGSDGDKDVTLLAPK